MPISLIEGTEYEQKEAHIEGTDIKYTIQPEPTTFEEDLQEIAIREKILEAPDEPVKPLLRMKHISHLDLDGYGATILSQVLQKLYPQGAMTLEVKNILPNRLNPEIEDTIAHIDDYDLVVITDLAINQALVDMVNACPQGKKIRVFDHHICSIDELPDNFIITDQSPISKGKLTCATELYYDFIRKDRVYGLIHDVNEMRKIAYFVECVRVYDTFEFWPSRNDDENEIDITYKDAPRLNTLFHIMDRDEFEEYAHHYFTGSASWDTITQSTPSYNWISKILQVEQDKNAKYVQSALKRLVKTPFNYEIFKNGSVHKFNYNIGVVFAEKSSPVIANTALEMNEDLDFCTVVSNNQVSIYSNKENIDVSYIAKLFGGGGHKEAAGFTIPYINSAIFNMNHFGQIIECAAMMTPGTIDLTKNLVIQNSGE